MSQIHPAGSVRSTACHLAKRKPQRKNQRQNRRQNRQSWRQR